MKKIYLLYLVNFLAAFLLFQIELIISKIFLPKFGGSYLVWGACIVFFQCVLLAGYGYSHLVTRLAGFLRYRYLHLLVILLPLFFFPGKPLPVIFANDRIALVIDVFGKLISSVGLVFFVLSTISIISQVWLAESSLSQKDNPFPLYAASNLGSFIALLSYPFIFEYYFDVNIQLAVWRLCYFVFILLYAVTFGAVSLSNNLGPVQRPRSLSGCFNLGGSFKENLYWLTLSVASTALFLAVTNIITYEIAPCPLLWIIPLCIYLLSFVLNFREIPLCPRWVKEKIHLVIGLSIPLFFVTEMKIFPFIAVIFAYFLCLFAFCMFCQYKLYTSRPQDKERLTAFYLVIASGGFLGGILVTWLVPVLFSATIEFLLGLFILGFALMMKEGFKKVGFYRFRLILYAIAVLFLWPKIFSDYNVFAVVFIFLIFKVIFNEFKTNLHSLYFCLFAILLMATWLLPSWFTEGAYFYAYRNYYGIYRLALKKDRTGEDRIEFLNGTTLHGMQYLDKARRNVPLAYYYPSSPIGKFFTEKIIEPKQMAVIGLGTGTIAFYIHAGQALDFYELDPVVFKIANRFFTYLKDCPAKINYYFGDARISLAKKTKIYDVIVVDAFSGDSIPTHLLTIEAITEYKKHLAENGFILFHVSNRYINLVPVLLSNALVVKASASVVSADAENELSLGSDWVALTWDRNSQSLLVDKLKWKEGNCGIATKCVRPWTDIYSNLLSMLRFNAMVSSLKRFRPFYW
jgi:hypothetical protein